MVLMFSYAALLGLVAAEGMVIREAVRRMASLIRSDGRLRPAPPERRLPLGVQAPEFCAQLLDTDGRLKTSDLRGHETILLFVSPQGNALSNSEQLAPVIHAFWHETRGYLYLVCHGSEEQCRAFVRKHQVRGFRENQVPVVLDEQGHVASSFLIENTPQAVRLDEEARVKRYGRPDPRGQRGDSNLGG